MRAILLIATAVATLLVAACGDSVPSKDRRYQDVTSAAICSTLDYSALKETVGDVSHTLAPNDVVESSRASCYRMSDTGGAVSLAFKAYPSHEEAKSAMDERVAKLLQDKGGQAEKVPELLKTVNVATTVLHNGVSRAALIVDGNLFMEVVGFHSQNTSAVIMADKFDAQLNEALILFVETAMPKLREFLHSKS